MIELFIFVCGFCAGIVLAWMWRSGDKGGCYQPTKSNLDDSDPPKLVVGQVKPGTHPEPVCISTEEQYMRAFPYAIPGDWERFKEAHGHPVECIPIEDSPGRIPVLGPDPLYATCPGCNKDLVLQPGEVHNCYSGGNTIRVVNRGPND
jgi:hypothetical protein